MEVTIRIQEADFDIAEEYGELRRRAGGDMGAVATFIGLVRDRDSASADTDSTDHPVATLYLEHYPEMTEASIARIIEAAGERWPLQDVLVIHRVGALAAAEQIVYVQVASGHRDAAFASAEFIMDYLKTDAVFWKREDSSGGSRWIESTAADRERREGWTREQT